MAKATIKVIRRLTEGGDWMPYATATIDRDRQTITVRKHRERQQHTVTLKELVDMVESRAVKQGMVLEVAQSIAPRKLRRGGR